MKLYLTLAAIVAFTAGSVYSYRMTSSHVTQINSPLILTPIQNKAASGTMKKTIYSTSLDPAHTVLLLGVIGENVAQVAQEITKKAESGKPVWLFISSPGGSVLDGGLIIDAVQASKAPVYTVCYELCASMAAMIFSYGNKRYMVDRSLLMYHNASGSVEGSFPQIKSRFHIFEQLVNKTDAEVAKRIGISYDEFKSRISDELWLDSDDAVQGNYADAILNPNLNALMSANKGAQEQLSQVKALKTKVLINESIY